MRIVVVQKRSVVPWIILFVILKLGLVSATKEKKYMYFLSTDKCEKVRSEYLSILIMYLF